MTCFLQNQSYISNATNTAIVMTLTLSPLQNKIDIKLKYLNPTLVSIWILDLCASQIIGLAILFQIGHAKLF